MQISELLITATYDEFVMFSPCVYMQISELLITAKYDEFVMFFDNILGGGSFGEEVNEALTLLADAILKEVK